MGKKDFGKIYRDCKAELGGSVTCKISYYSDKFEQGKNFGAVIIYKRNDKSKWVNDKGSLKGHSGRSFYVIIQKTDGWDVEQKGTGKMHPFVIENHMGIKKFDQPKIFCGGGWAYYCGQVRYHSWWLNSGIDGCCNVSYPSDKDLDMSAKEKKLVDHIFKEWTKYGPHTIIKIPASLDKELSSYS
eukprot:949146_1